jgi:anti-sigma regulatory factor (Ser/Thr protein kinase)
MRPSTADQTGLRHELVLHRSTEEMLESVVPFVRDGIAAQEPTLLLVRPETAATVLHRVGTSPYLTLLPGPGQVGRPASDLRATDSLLAGYGPRSRRVRIVSQEPVVPEPHWHEWRRLEAVINVALHHRNTWVVCVYDRRSLTDEMVDDLYATHPLAGRGEQHRRNDRYQDPVEFIGKHQDAPPDPIEQETPSAQLIDPSPAAARAAIAGFAGQTRLPAHDVENVVLATHEAVSNALLHGRPPVVLRLWVRPGGLTVTVTDTGIGPSDPFVGLLPPTPPNGAGLGLWISHQLVDVTHRRHPDGYTVRLAAAALPLNRTR